MSYDTSINKSLIINLRKDFAVCIKFAILGAVNVMINQ